MRFKKFVSLLTTIAIVFTVFSCLSFTTPKVGAAQANNVLNGATYRIKSATTGKYVCAPSGAINTNVYMADIAPSYDEKAFLFKLVYDSTTGTYSIRSTFNPANSVSMSTDSADYRNIRIESERSASSQRWTINYYNGSYEFVLQSFGYYALAGNPGNGYPSGTGENTVGNVFAHTNGSTNTKFILELAYEEGDFLVNGGVYLIRTSLNYYWDLPYGQNTLNTYVTTYYTPRSSALQTNRMFKAIVNNNTYVTFKSTLNESLNVAAGENTVLLSNQETPFYFLRFSNGSYRFYYENSRLSDSYDSYPNTSAFILRWDVLDDSDGPDYPNYFSEWYLERVG